MHYVRYSGHSALRHIEAAISPKLRTGRFKATDKLITLLEGIYDYAE